MILTKAGTKTVPLKGLHLHGILISYGRSFNLRLHVPGRTCGSGQDLWFRVTTVARVFTSTFPIYAVTRATPRVGARGASNKKAISVAKQVPKTVRHDSHVLWFYLVAQIVLR
jgi:hypothetical protein